jgi:hypothetical protein
MVTAIHVHRAQVPIVHRVQVKDVPTEIATHVHHHVQVQIAQLVAHMVIVILVRHHVQVLRVQAKAVPTVIVIPVRLQIVRIVRLVHMAIATHVQARVRHPIARHVQVKAAHTVIATHVQARVHRRIARHVQVKVAHTVIATHVLLHVQAQIVRAAKILMVAIVQKLVMIVAIARLRVLANAVVVQIAPVAGLLMTAKNVHVVALAKSGSMF